MPHTRLEIQVDEWVDLTRSLLARTWLPRWHLAVLPHLSRTFGSAASFNWVEPDQPEPLRAEIYRAPAGWPRPEHERDWMALIAQHHPLLLWYARTGTDAAMATQKVPSALLTAQDVGIYRDLLGCFDLDRQISLPLSMHGMDHQAFVVARGDDFSPQEQHLALLIQPLLRLLHRQSMVLSQLAGPTTAQVEVTGQELAVLRLLAQGASARTIAHQLRISERTVNKHLQNAYRKLSAHDRVSALVAAASAGLLAPSFEDPLGRRGGQPTAPQPAHRADGLLLLPNQVSAPCVQRPGQVA